MTKCVALIPARGGSKRVPGKNVRPLNGNPLIAYTVAAAMECGEFDKVMVSSDDPSTLEIAHSYGADVLRRPDQFATDVSPDIQWISHALGVLGGSTAYDTFSILRPTSPFRTPATIRRAFAEWRTAHDKGARYSSLRAVEKCGQHPGKMWRIHGEELMPLLLQPGMAGAVSRVIPTETQTQPWHDSQYAALPAVYVQNAALEIAWTQTVEQTGTISGSRILPFLTHGHEGLDVNTELDWKLAEILLEKGQVALPSLTPPDEKRISVA